MKAQDYRELLAPQFPSSVKFKGFQVVWFLYNGGIEKGVIRDVHQYPSIQPRYTIIYLDEELEVHLVEIHESAIFSSLEDTAEWCKTMMNESDRYHTLKHYQKYYASIDDNMMIPIDEYLASKMI
jgi:hypothetical protein